MTTPARARYAGYRFPAEIIGHAVWLYFRFPLGLRMAEELLAARGMNHRQPRNRATMGAQVRPTVRQPDPSPPSPSRRQMASGSLTRSRGDLGLYDAIATGGPDDWRDLGNRSRLRRSAIRRLPPAAAAPGRGAARSDQATLRPAMRLHRSRAEIPRSSRPVQPGRGGDRGSNRARSARVEPSQSQRARNRRFADSLLEETGFELSVPHKTGSGFEASSEFGADRLSARRYYPGRVELIMSDRWFR
jgi:hypothetical protein